MIPDFCCCCCLVFLVFFVGLFWSRMWSKILWLSVRAPLCSSSSSREQGFPLFRWKMDECAGMLMRDNKATRDGPSPRQPAPHQDADAFRTHLLWAHGGLLGFTFKPENRECNNNGLLGERARSVRSAHADNAETIQSDAAHACIATEVEITTTKRKKKKARTNK